jgi:hypothetical protein
MSPNDLVKDFVLQLLRRGFTTAQVAEALAAQKVALMQTDEYLVAIKEADWRP